MTDTGVGTNFSQSPPALLQPSGNVSVEVNTKVTYNVKLVPVDETATRSTASPHVHRP